MMMRASDPVRSNSSAGAAWANPANADRREAVRAWTLALVLLCLCALWLQFRHIDRTLPYPRHVDEAFISGPARRIVVTGTLHPYRFNYPSLPTYLTAAGMAVGFLRGATDHEIEQVQKIGNVGYPYYETRPVMQTARQLFAVLALIALAATGFTAWVAFRRPVAILLAPLLLVLSPLFFFHSWVYLNADIVGTCWVVLTIAACLAGTRRPSIAQSALLPGVFAGLATGSKYSLAVVILPVLLAIGLYVKGSRRLWAWAAALAVMVAAFLVVVPYSLIDIPGFLNGVASEAFHYASGHAGFAGQPGWPQLLFYARHLAHEFGLAGLALSALGVSVYAAADWRRAAVLASFPAALLWLLASQRVHFTRNVLSLHPLVALFMAVGLITLHGWVVGLAARRGWFRPSRKGTAGVIAALVLVMAAVPWWHAADELRDGTDSRNLAQAWLEAHVPPDWTIVVPKQLGFDARPLEAAGRRVKVVDAGNAGALESLPGEVAGPAVIMAPRWGADSRFPGGGQVNALNEISRRWHALQSFGTNPVLVNYSYPNPWGDPAFAVAVLK